MNFMIHKKHCIVRNYFILENRVEDMCQPLTTKICPSIPEVIKISSFHRSVCQCVILANKDISLSIGIYEEQHMFIQTCNSSSCEYMNMNYMQLNGGTSVNYMMIEIDNTVHPNIVRGEVEVEGIMYYFRFTH